MNEVFNVAWNNAGNKQSKIAKTIFFLECKEEELQEQLNCQSIPNKNVSFFFS